MYTVDIGPEVGKSQHDSLGGSRRTARVDNDGYLPVVAVPRGRRWDIGRRCLLLVPVDDEHVYVMADLRESLAYDGLVLQRSPDTFRTRIVEHIREVVSPRRCIDGDSYAVVAPDREECVYPALAVFGEDDGLFCIFGRV